LDQQLNLQVEFMMLMQDFGTLVRLLPHRSNFVYSSKRVK
jgi:hypothetical protein